jgi:hypothetical protein
VAVSLALLTLWPRRTRVLVARWLALAVFLVAGLGMLLHVSENLEAGAPDGADAATWERRPAVERLWLAATGSLGDAPLLAPGVLAEMGFALFLASLRHPALPPR